MELLLLVVSAQQHDMGSEASRLFHTSGGTIGRAASCDWILPDKQRHLSGKHAAINFQNGAFYLTDTSTNGVFINGSTEPLGRGNQHQLRHGDRIQLADFEMVVELRDDAQRIPDSFDKTEFSGSDFGQAPSGFGQDHLIDSPVNQDRFDPVSAFGDETPSQASSFDGVGGDSLLNDFGNGGSHDPYKGFIGNDGLQKDHDSVMDSYFEPPKPQESQWDNFNASLDNPPPQQPGQANQEQQLESFSALDDPTPQPASQSAPDILSDFGGATDQSQTTEPPAGYFKQSPGQQPLQSDQLQSEPDFSGLSSFQSPPSEPNLQPEPAPQIPEGIGPGEGESQGLTEAEPFGQFAVEPDTSNNEEGVGGFALGSFGFKEGQANNEPSANVNEPLADLRNEPPLGMDQGASLNIPDEPFDQMGLAADPADRAQFSLSDEPSVQPPSFEVPPAEVEPPVQPAPPAQPAQSMSQQAPPSTGQAAGHHEPVIRQYQNHSQPPAQAAPTPSADQQPVQMDKAFLILLQELGIDPNSIPPEQLNVLPKIIGQMTRKTIGGLIQLLMSRANLKNEFRMSVTMIQTQENNPLKFCINEEQAIKQMLENPMTGYLGPVEALEEALNDFQVHQLAVMSATRSALNYMLKRLDPERLEQKFEESKSKGMMLGNKRARYWEAYKEFYQDILEEENVFQSLFGNEFANAYEKQVQAFLNGKKGD